MKTPYVYEAERHQISFTIDNQLIEYGFYHYHAGNKTTLKKINFVHSFFGYHLEIKGKNMKEFYLKKDIEKYLKQNKLFNTKIYEAFKDMIKNEEFLNTDSENIFEYTDGLFPFNDSKCYIIEGKIYPDEQYGKNVIFIHYNKNEIPTAIFIEDNFCKIINEVTQMVNKSINYLSK